MPEDRSKGFFHDLLNQEVIATLEPPGITSDNTEDAAVLAWVEIWAKHTYIVVEVNNGNTNVSIPTYMFQQKLEKTRIFFEIPSLASYLAERKDNVEGLIKGSKILDHIRWSIGFGIRKMGISQSQSLISNSCAQRLAFKNSFQSSKLFSAHEFLSSPCHT
jgi:hypothetical protein